ncbi:Ig-like domain-containing protein [Prescottella subtropica]|uniref:Ig-like domain-containing protein n=1 Tax=Prescottella subtropica TaxID=2545757 RepID=UPI0010F8CD53|nr:Ig-like domain-containing protein [Prescottella subtropica]
MKKNMRRMVAGAGTAVLAVGVATSFGAATANAFSVNTNEGIGGRWTIDRTIEDVPAGTGTRPEIGSRIKVSATLGTDNVLPPTVTAVKDVHDPCLTYVTDSSRINGKGVGTESEADSVRMTGSWITKSLSYEVQYDVTPNCAVGVDLLSSVHVAANLSLSTTPTTVGPTFQVTKAATATTVTATPAPQAGAASTLTATVSAGATGDVEFSNDGIVLGTATVVDGTATVVWTPAAADADRLYSITAAYRGDASHEGSVSDPLTGTVAPAGGTGSLGSLGSLSGLFGSLFSVFGTR